MLLRRCSVASLLVKFLVFFIEIIFVTELVLLFYFIYFSGQFGSHGGCGRDGLNESRLTDLLRGSEYVVTYEDKDSDWMLVGDVPWE